MTRKQRQSRAETYDLSNPRNVAAFEALLEAEEGHADADPHQLPPRGKRGQQQQKREKEKFFKLRPGVEQSRQTTNDVPTANSKDQLQHLIHMFQGTCDAHIVTDVFTGTGNNFHAAIDALLSISGGDLPVVPPAADELSHGRAAGQPAGSSSSSSAAQLAGGLPWKELPDDVKLAILSHLPLRDLARAAHTSKEFHERASSMRRQVQHLVMQPGLGYSAMVGMVRSHGAAAVVDLSRLEKHISRQNPAEMNPKVVAMHKQEAEANLWKAVLAVSEGDAGGTRELLVTGLVLTGLVGATDRVLAEALQNLKGLRSLAISHCPALTNKSLYAIAKYKASEGFMPPPQQQQQPGATDSEDGGADEDYVFGTSEEWEQWPDSEDDSSRDDVDHQDLNESDPEDGQNDSSSSEEAGSSMTAAAASTDVTAASHAAGASDNSTVDVASSNPAIRNPVNAALTAAVTNRLAAVQLQAQQQAVAAAASAAAAAANPVGFQELRLSGNSAWADDGLRQLLQGPVTKHSLAKLDISGCRGITSAGLIIPPLGVLRDLRACRLNGLTQLVVHLPASHPLTSLDLSNCHYLRKVDLHLSNLHRLNLAACRTLYRLRMRCPVLKTLSLSQCGMLHDFHTDAWQVPALQRLNMFGCRRASGQMLQMVLDILPELQHIDLNGCWAITRLHLTANPKLESVDITGCRNLMTFSSSSTALTELQAASCGRLYSLTLASSRLLTLQLQNCVQLTEVFVPGNTGIQATAGASSSGRQRKSGMLAAGRGVSVNGCSALSADAKARLASIVGNM